MVIVMKTVKSSGVALVVIVFVIIGLILIIIVNWSLTSLN